MLYGQHCLLDGNEQREGTSFIWTWTLIEMAGSTHDKNMYWINAMRKIKAGWEDIILGLRREKRKKLCRRLTRERCWGMYCEWEQVLWVLGSKPSKEKGDARRQSVWSNNGGKLVSPKKKQSLGHGKDLQEFLDHVTKLYRWVSLVPAFSTGLTFYLSEAYHLELGNHFPHGVMATKPKVRSLLWGSVISKMAR